MARLQCGQQGGAQVRLVDEDGRLLPRNVGRCGEMWGELSI